MRFLILVVAAWLVLTSSRVAQAVEPGQGVVVVVFADDPEDRRVAVVRALSGHFASGEPSLQVTTSARAPSLREQADQVAAIVSRDGRRGGFWLDLSSGSEAQLFFVEPGARRVLLRRIAWSDAATTSEEVAVVARATADALVEGGTIGMAPAPGLEPRPTPGVIAPGVTGPGVTERATEPAAPTLPRPFVEPRRDAVARIAPAPVDEERRWEVHAAFDATTISSDLPFLAGLGIGGAYAPISRLWLGAEIAVHPGTTLVTERGDRLSLRKLRVEAGAAYRADIGWLRLGGWGGIFGEMITRTTVALAGDVRATPSSDAGVVGASVRGEIGVGTPTVGAFVHAGPDVAFNPPRFAVELNGATPTEIAATAIVRFHGMAGVALRFR